MENITELTLNEIVAYAEQIMGEWDGDNAGTLEDRATIAEQILTNAEAIIELNEELIQ